jgi:ATP-dependent DNA ligase
LQARSGKSVPTGPDWIHEVKYDGYRGRIVRDGRDVQLLSKSGLDWARRFPFVVETAMKMKQQRFIIDGEICVLDVQGVSDFDALHSNRHNEEAQLYAFDLVALDGDDLRETPLFERKARLGKLLKGRPEGVSTMPARSRCRKSWRGRCRRHDPFRRQAPQQRRRPRAAL